LWRISERKPEGAAVTSTESTGAVGSCEARRLAMGPRERRTAGSVGRAVMPAKEASCRSWEMSAWGWGSRFSLGEGAAIVRVRVRVERRRVRRVEERIFRCGRR